MSAPWPCPFCLHEAHLAAVEVNTGEWAVCCPECRATGPIVETAEAAVLRWNVLADIGQDDSWINQIGSV